MRVLALDYGDKTIGAAVSDPLGVIATGLGVIRRSEERNLKDSLVQLSRIIRDYGVSSILLGYPKNMNNTEGPRCEKTLWFKEKLEQSFKGIPVVLWDERLSTVAALQSLAGASHKKVKQKVDELAAVYFLQGYLDSIKTKDEREVTNLSNDFMGDLFEEDNDGEEMFEEEYERITLIDDEGDEITLVVLDAAENEDGVYMLVVEGEDTESEETEASILKCISQGEDQDPIYEFVEDDDEFEKASQLFFDEDEDTFEL